MKRDRVPPETAAPSAVSEDRRALLLSARNLSKDFGARRVLDGVDLDIAPGEVHGLVGQNGSGKSTLIKILAGFHTPADGASLTIGGEEVPLPLTPDQPGRLGIHFVHQDLALVDSATILENLCVSRYRTRFGRIRWARERAVVRDALERFGLEWSPDTMVETLGATERALLAIARAFSLMRLTGTGVLVADEPTAYLARDGVDRLFGALRRVASEGSGVLFVGHDLSEILSVTDRVTVLREGRRVGTFETAALNERGLAEQILGFPLEDLYPEERHTSGKPVFELTAETAAGGFSASLDVREGEIVGVTGLLGSGFERVPYAAFGADPDVSGRVAVDGEERPLARLRPSDAIGLGLALIPQDRVRQGGVREAAASENVSLLDLGRYRSRGRLDVRRERTRTQELMAAFNVVPPDPAKLFGEFSGGNQQKLVLAKWFELEPRVILLAEPTQGVDIGARREILARIRAMADQGAAILIASSEHSDLAHLCDRVLIFRKGRVAEEIGGGGLTHERILERCMIQNTTEEVNQ